MGAWDRIVTSHEHTIYTAEIFSKFGRAERPWGVYYSNANAKSGLLELSALLRKPRCKHGLGCRKRCRDMIELRFEDLERNFMHVAGNGAAIKSVMAFDASGRSSSVGLI